MKIATALSGVAHGHGPTRVAAPTRAANPTRIGLSPPPGIDTADIGAASAAPTLEAAAAQKTGGGTAMRLAAVLGLGLVALGLAGCGEGNLPGIPGMGKPPDSSQGEQERQQVETVEQRLEALKKGDKAGYAAFNEANYYRHVLGEIATEQDESAKEQVELATKVLEAFDVNGDPVELRDGLREVVTAIGAGEDAEGVVGRHQEIARAAVEVGFGLRAEMPGGFVAQLKAQGYQKALDQVLTLPGRVDQVPIPEALKDLPDEMARGMLRNYAESLAGSAEVALETGQEVKDPAVQAVLYENTLEQIYERMSTDTTLVSGQLRSVIEAALQLKDKFL